MLILDLWGISFHPAVVVGLGNDLLFNSSVGHCGSSNCHRNNLIYVHRKSKDSQPSDFGLS